MPLLDAANLCDTTTIISNYVDCLEGESVCTSVEFNNDSYNEILQYSFSLLPGSGCEVGISRTDDGSYGTMTFTFEDESILIFDEYQHEVNSTNSLGLLYVPEGWDPR